MNESKETAITKRYAYNNYSLQVVTENPNHEWNRDPGTSSFGPLDLQICHDKPSPKDKSEAPYCHIVNLEFTGWV